MGCTRARARRGGQLSRGRVTRVGTRETQPPANQPSSSPLLSSLLLFRAPPRPILSRYDTRSVGCEVPSPYISNSRENGRAYDSQSSAYHARSQNVKDTIWDCRLPSGNPRSNSLETFFPRNRSSPTKRFLVLCTVDTCLSSRCPHPTYPPSTVPAS